MTYEAVSWATDDDMTVWCSARSYDVRSVTFLKRGDTLFVDLDTVTNKYARVITEDGASGYVLSCAIDFARGHSV